MSYFLICFGSFVLHVLNLNVPVLFISSTLVFPFLRKS